MNNYCTLFDSNYLLKGLSLYNSLFQHSKQKFLLYILPMDDDCEFILKQMRLKRVVVLSRTDFETNEILNIKKKRNRAEYCWTCTPLLLEYVLNSYNPLRLTYLDADIYFLSDPEPLTNIEPFSVSITPHRYTPKYNQEETSGVYCVQFMTFVNNKSAEEVLERWKMQCLENCELNPEKGFCGDQKYLDEWPTRYKCILELTEDGAGVAPWNMQQYSILRKNGQVIGKKYIDNNEFDIIFFHFHGFNIYEKLRVEFTVYDVSLKILLYVYLPYWINLHRNANKIVSVKKNFFKKYNTTQFGFKEFWLKTLKLILKSLRYRNDLQSL